MHYGLAAVKAIERSQTLAAARAWNPERFTTNTDPKILTVPERTWINKPINPEKKDPPQLARIVHEGWLLPVS